MNKRKISVHGRRAVVYTNPTNKYIANANYLVEIPTPPTWNRGPASFVWSIEPSRFAYHKEDTYRTEVLPDKAANDALARRVIEVLIAYDRT